jgi:hypothetical protein
MPTHTSSELIGGGKWSDGVTEVLPCIWVLSKHRCATTFRIIFILGVQNFLFDTTTPTSHTPAGTFPVMSVYRKEKETLAVFNRPVIYSFPEQNAF